MQGIKRCPGSITVALEFRYDACLALFITIGGKRQELQRPVGLADLHACDLSTIHNFETHTIAKFLATYPQSPSHDSTVTFMYKSCRYITTGATLLWCT